MQGKMRKIPGFAAQKKNMCYTIKNTRNRERKKVTICNIARINTVTKFLLWALAVCVFSAAEAVSIWQRRNGS